MIADDLHSVEPSFFGAKRRFTKIMNQLFNLRHTHFPRRGCFCKETVWAIIHGGAFPAKRKNTGSPALNPGGQFGICTRTRKVELHGDLRTVIMNGIHKLAPSRKLVPVIDPKLANNGILRAPSTARFLPKEQQEAWQPALDFTRFDVVLPTAVLATDGGVRPRWTRLDANYPNPFNAATVLRFSLARAADVELAVRALDGHLVRRLHAGPLAAGAHSITWDGRDAEGRAAASGVYLAELRSAAGRQAMKMLLLR